MTSFALLARRVPHPHLPRPTYRCTCTGGRIVGPCGTDYGTCPRCAGTGWAR